MTAKFAFFPANSTIIQAGHNNQPSLEIGKPTNKSKKEEKCEDHNKSATKKINGKSFDFRKSIFVTKNPFKNKIKKSYDLLKHFQSISQMNLLEEFARVKRIC